MPADRVAVVVSARNEAERLGDTLAALQAAFPGALVTVADDASTDATAQIARGAGVAVVSAARRLGKGGATTLAARAVLERAEPRVVVLCDGDLGASARRLPALAETLARDEGDLAVAVFARRVGGGLGLVLRFSRAVIERLTGLSPRAPISGQRAMGADVLRAVLPFAPGFAMETAMTIDAHRAGFRLVEVELDLEHRATGRSAADFLHRGRQLVDIARAVAVRHGRSKKGPGRRP